MKLRELIVENLDRTGESKSAVVGWGRGMGHKGHMMLASSVLTQAKDSGSDPYFVISRTMGKDDPLSPDEKLEIYNKVFPDNPQVFRTATEEMPDLNRVLKKLATMGYGHVTVVVGADQVNAFQYLVRPDKSGVEPYKQFGLDSMNVISRQQTNDPSKKQEGPRATPMRKALTDPEGFKADNPEYANMPTDQMQFNVWRDAMSPEISDDEVRNLMQTALQRMQDFSKPKARNKKVAAVDEEAAGVGIITKQNTTADVNKNTPKKNLRAFKLAEAIGLIEQELKEAKTKQIRKSQKQAMSNALTYPELNMSTGSAYRNYRFGVALAGSPDHPGEADNWIGGDPLLEPYTEEEMEKIKGAEKALGLKNRQNWSGKGSKELEDNIINKTSPIAKIKKNRYGV